MSDSPDARPWLVVAGYMGAGKSTVGRRLARRLHREFVDADRVIEERAGMAIPEIFSRRGEVWFRRTERQVILELVHSAPSGVLALGGGALGSEVTRGLLARECAVVWLRVDPEVAWRRVGGSDRPLAQDRERFVRRSAQREPLYREVADLEVDASAPVDKVVARVAAWAESREAAAR